MEDLLKPRYKVIADYPQALWEVGAIIPTEVHSIKNLSNEMIAFYDKYPHLFKKLEWWQERKVEELPEYIKHKNIVYKVDEWDIIMMYPKTTSVDGQVSWYWKKENFLPATKEEYEKYVENKIREVNNYLK